MGVMNKNNETQIDFNSGFQVAIKSGQIKKNI